jgi:hypothetical protein
MATSLGLVKKTNDKENLKATKRLEVLQERGEIVLLGFALERVRCYSVEFAERRIYLDCAGLTFIVTAQVCQ